MSEDDQRLMAVALRLAQLGRGHVEPNPMVGCVIVSDGQIIGEGYHRQFGGPHAEVNALRSVASPTDVLGATAYVTLEPCCHFGKTPPCSDALIGSGIARVVIAMEDPFDQVAGGGIRRLRDAGIRVDVGVLRDEAEALAAPFVKRVRQARPWVIAKWAMTIDGRIATTIGQSQWITGASSRAAVHAQRGIVDAIVVGMGTVIADDPLLTARPAGPRQAIRVVFCRRRLPSLQSKLMQTVDQGGVMLAVGSEVDVNELGKLRSRGVEVIESGVLDPVAMVDPVLEKLAARGATNVVVEGGAEVLGSFFSANSVDECHVYIGAKAFGGAAAPGPIGGLGVGELSQAWSFRIVTIDRFDDDVRLVYHR